MTSSGDHARTPIAEPLSARTLVARVLRSAAFRAEGELEFVTATSIIRGRPDDRNYVSDLWHRTREQIAEERHDAASRLPEAIGDNFVELTDVRVAPLTEPDRETRLEDLVLFMHAVIGMRATRRPDRMAH